MWYNELLFALMFTALIGIGVMALIVKVKMSQRKNSIEKKMEIPEKIHEPEKTIRYEPTPKVVEPEPEPEPLETIEISETLFKPIIIQGVNPEPMPSTVEEPPNVAEPTIMSTVEEPAEPVIEPLTETNDEVRAESPASPTIEPQPTPPEPSPPETDLKREADNQFFDLRYEHAQQDTTNDVPTILDEAPSLDYEEEQKEEPLSGVVTCPHCKSEVPQTLYCIYCGNTLMAKPLAAAR